MERARIATLVGALRGEKLRRGLADHSVASWLEARTALATIESLLTEHAPTPQQQHEAWWRDWAAICGAGSCPSSLTFVLQQAFLIVVCRTPFVEIVESAINAVRIMARMALDALCTDQWPGVWPWLMHQNVLPVMLRTMKLSLGFLDKDSATDVLGSAVLLLKEVHVYLAKQGGTAGAPSSSSAAPGGPMPAAEPVAVLRAEGPVVAELLLWMLRLGVPWLDALLTSSPPTEWGATSVEGGLVGMQGGAKEDTGMARLGRPGNAGRLGGRREGSAEAHLSGV